jgi:hypothetical protein
MKRYVVLLLSLLTAVLRGQAQEFFNLTAQQVRIDSVLPVFSHQVALGAAYADSVYEVSIDYPEFLPMSPTDVARYQRITSERLPAMPRVEQYVAVDRKRGMLVLSFVPLVERDGKMQKLVSFKLSVKAAPNPLVSEARRSERAGGAAFSPKGAATAGSRYADHSVLASGTWAKIRVPSTGVYQITSDLVRQAGFSRPEKVKVYGYGGALQPEDLTADYLTETDDLHEVPTCTVGGRRLFYATGPVTWPSATEEVRIRNYCSDYGYYFLTESDDEPLTQDSAAFVASFYPSSDDYHSLYEQDGYAWYHSGRNLYASAALSSSPTTYKIDSPSSAARLTIAMSYDGPFACSVAVNDSVVGQMEVTEKQASDDFSEYRYASAAVRNFSFELNILKQGDNTIALTQTSGRGTMRTDYLMLTFSDPRPAPSLSAGVLPVPEFVYRITNQDLHADKGVQMVIIIPATQKLLEQAERLKTLHTEHDGLNVKIVPADELYNEFSSGTPDVAAYRRYMKMLYDRAETDDEQPRYLLLLGDGAWDNRMVSSDWRSLSPDDFLLCFESENSFSTTYSFVADDYFAMLDDGELLTSYQGKPDVAVGRISVRTASDAKIVVDKIVDYVGNEAAGSWQNVVCVMGDDGNSSQHMKDADIMANTVLQTDEAYYIKKVYWDAYTRVASSTGNSYPEVERTVQQQMADGALIMNYSGHGGPYCLSHEQAVKLTDFKTISCGRRLPLWVTASCDTAPFDTQEDNLAENALLNPSGGAIAFLGTARTVFMNLNQQINKAFMSEVLASTNGQRHSIGEALRLAKNSLVDTNSDLSQNKLHYVLLGDPALVLSSPTGRVVIDSINGQAVGQNTVQLNAGSKATVAGHIEGQPSFSGVVTALVLDREETIVCKLNEVSTTNGSETPYQFNTRSSMIYSGSDSVRNGRFSLQFALSRDISYSSESGQLIAYAVDSKKTSEAHGQMTGFIMGEGDAVVNDGVGPSIYCYLNSTSFQNGGTVNATPYFYATLTDKDGINAAGSGIGHDLQLVVDGELSRTYNLNNYFQYDFGDYRSGSVGYSLPALSEGSHRLQFRAWDVLGNSSVAELQFVVDPTQQPDLLSVICVKNPAVGNTQFVINHNRTGSQMDVTLQVLDASGRLLWQRSESGVSTDQTYTVKWDLTTSSGSLLRTGVYLYRVLVSSGGSTEATAARKLIILGNN